MHPEIQLIVKQTVKLYFTATGPDSTKPLSTEMAQGKSVSPQIGQTMPQPVMQNVRLLFSVSLLPLPPAL